jgi:hypothetical protein
MLVYWLHGIAEIWMERTGDWRSASRHSARLDVGSAAESLLHGTSAEYWTRLAQLLTRMGRQGAPDAAFEITEPRRRARASQSIVDSELARETVDFGSHFLALRDLSSVWLVAGDACFARS